MATHDFHDKCTLMRVGSGSDSINGFNNTMQCRVGTYGHVSATKVIVDGPNHSYDAQMTKLSLLLNRYFT